MGTLAKFLTVCAFLTVFSIVFGWAVYRSTSIEYGMGRMTARPSENIRIDGINITEKTIYARNLGKINVTITSYDIELPKSGTEVWQENVNYLLEVGGATKTITLSKDLTTLPAGAYFVRLISSNHQKFYLSFEIPQGPAS